MYDVTAPVSILSVTFRKVRRTPTADWLANKLFRRHNESKYNQHGARHVS